jgi:hypothetical protein
MGIDFTTFVGDGSKKLTNYEENGWRGWLSRR